jgi:two-component system OmpR family response regulator
METLADKKPFNVFVVDDDQSYLAVLGFRLMKESKSNGTKIYCYSTGEECLRNMDLDPSAIVLDYFLDAKTPAAMSGLQTLRKIKAVNPDVPVIMLSSQSDINVALEIFEAGAYSYIVKDRQALDAVERTIGELMTVQKDKVESVAGNKQSS